MHPFIWELLVLLLLVVINALFAISETAILTSRKALLHQWADQGNEGAKEALTLSSSPSQFLSTVQIGVTLVGILAGAYGGATLADTVAEYLAAFPPLAAHARPLALGLVVLGVTYVNIVLGELVPKRLALHNPEKVAMSVARPLRGFSVIASPVVTLLSYSTDIVTRLFGVGVHRETPVTEEEIKVLIDQGTQAGLFEEAEQDMVERVFRLGDRRVNALMTPRTDIAWIDTEEPLEEIRKQLIEIPYSRVPVAHGNLDEVLGVVSTRDLLAQILEGKPLDVKAATKPPLFVPETMGVLKLMDHFKQSGTHVALVIEEFGGVQGLVTFNDVLQALVGDLSPFHEEMPRATKREDGSWLVDGLMPIDEFKDLFDLDQLPEEDRGDYLTVGGFIVMQIGRIPEVADHFVWTGLYFEVLDMDGNRVDKVLVVRRPEETGEEAHRENDNG